MHAYVRRACRRACKAVLTPKPSSCLPACLAACLPASCLPACLPAPPAVVHALPGNQPSRHPLPVPDFRRLRRLPLCVLRPVYEGLPIPAQQVRPGQCPGLAALWLWRSCSQCTSEHRWLPCASPRPYCLYCRCRSYAQFRELNIFLRVEVRSGTQLLQPCPFLLHPHGLLRYAMHDAAMGPLQRSLHSTVKVIRPRIGALEHSSALRSGGGGTSLTCTDPLIYLFPFLHACRCASVALRCCTSC